MAITHPIPPLFGKDAKILILGSFPSVKSREAMFFYGHPQNRFWKVTSSVLNESVPQTVEEKKELILSHQIALWDVIASCEITGSSDSSIRHVVANDLSRILDVCPIEAIFTNGTKSYDLYMKYLFPQVRVAAIKLPSTSPANASFSLEQLISIWKEELTKYVH